MADISELDNKVTMTWGLLKTLATSLAITIFTITTVYWRFQASERELQVLQEKMEYERERTDRKINPVRDDLEGLREELMLEKIEILEFELSQMKKDD
jgi:hypothetical protein